MTPEFFLFRDRLAQFRAVEDGTGREFWERRWSNHDISKLHASYQAGKLDDFEQIFLKYLPKDYPVIEAGCGNGQLVVGLTAHGYQAEGVDYATQTISKLQEAAPDLSFRVGDVYHLDVSNGYYGGYISIGIFEHNPDGPLDGLREVNRVLHPGGVALISVPFLNQERLKNLSNVSKIDQANADNSLVFYQYYFSVEDFVSLLNKANLEVVEIYPYALYSGLTRDFPFWKWLHKQGFFFWPIHRRFIHWCKYAPHWVRSRWAHMVMYVCRKRE